MTTGVHACAICTRLDPTAEVQGDALVGSCEAFPDGIPEAIWDGSHAHQVPFDGEDLLFEAIEGEDPGVYVDLFKVLTGKEPTGVVPNPG